MSNSGHADELLEQQTKKYDQADLEEFCLWLYGLYEDEIVKSEYPNREKARHDTFN